MVQEYLFTSDQYKADLENLIISPKVTKEITKFENSKCWTLLISVPGVSLDAAKTLDEAVEPDYDEAGEYCGGKSLRPQSGIKKEDAFL